MTKRANYGSGSILKHDDPHRFTLRWSEGVDPFTGKHMRRTMTINDATITEARRILAAKTSGRRLTTRMTLGELLDITLPQLPVTEATRERYRYALAHVPDGARNWRVSDITVTMAGSLIDGLADRHGPATVQKAHTAILSCWKQSYRNGWVDINTNPFRALKLPAVTRSAGIILTGDEINRLLAAVEPGAETAWITIALGTGARPGEVLGLRWSAVDLEQAVIFFTDTKHGGVVRPVAITDTVCQILGDWRASQARQGPLCADPYLFSLAVDASRPWLGKYAGRDRWHKLRERAGIRPELRLYDLRHTHNSALAAAGISREARGLRAGNSPAVNDKIYTHRHPDADRAAAAVVEGWFG